MRREARPELLPHLQSRAFSLSPAKWLGCRCRHPTAHTHTHTFASTRSSTRGHTHTHPHTPAHRHTLIGRNKISDLSARAGCLGVKGSVRLFVSLRAKQRHDKTWSSSARPSIAICAMHAARTYLEYYDVGSYHAVDTSLMYGTDAVPFYKERVYEQTFSRDQKHGGGLTHTRHIIILISLFRYNQDSF